MRLSHSEARSVLLSVFADLGYPLKTRSLQVLGAIASAESGYGSRANNWGSIQCSDPLALPCKPWCVEATDYTSKGIAYRACYQKFPTPEEGARGFVRNLMTRGNGSVRHYVETGTANDVASAMKRTRYYEKPISEYAGAIRYRGKEIARELGEPYLLDTPEPFKVQVSEAVSRIVTTVLEAITLGLDKGTP